MKNIECIALELIVALGGCTCFAQKNPVPFAQILQDAKQQTHLVSSVDSPGMSDSSSASSSSTSGVVELQPSPVATHPVLDKNYFLLNGLHLAVGLADVESTQHCIAAHRCREGNPIMPSSQAGQITVIIGTFTTAAATSYWLKKHKSRMWWVSPTVGMIAHSIGVASGLRYW